MPTISDLLKSNGLTQKQLSEALNESEAQVSRWCGGSMPRAETLIKVANFFGVRPEEIERSSGKNGDSPSPSPTSPSRVSTRFSSPPTPFSPLAIGREIELEREKIALERELMTLQSTFSAVAQVCYIDAMQEARRIDEMLDMGLDGEARYHATESRDTLREIADRLAKHLPDSGVRGQALLGRKTRLEINRREDGQ